MPLESSQIPVLHVLCILSFPESQQKHVSINNEDFL